MRGTADLLTLPLRRTLDLLDGFGTRRQAQSKVTVGKKLKVLKAKVKNWTIFYTKIF